MKMIIEIDKDDFEKKFNTALQGIALQVQEALKDRLTREHGKDTGLLQSSIRAEVKDHTIVISMAEHGKYVEFGTPPHFPPVEELEGWAQRKLGDKKLAWAVAYAISRRGTRPYPFIRPTFHTEVIPIVQNNLIRAFK